MGIIITIDGPAGAGKSTTAKLLAERLGFDFLDTGAMYRAVALACLRISPPPYSEEFLESITGSLKIKVDSVKVFLLEEDVTSQIRTPDVSKVSGIVAASEIVRKRMVELQRLAVAGKNVVSEGRDQGTVVFPKAQCKFFLTAKPEARAERRFSELKARGIEVNLKDLIQENQIRDERDASRSIGPMVPAADAIMIDSSHMDTGQVVNFMEHEVRLRCSK